MRYSAIKVPGIGGNCKRDAERSDVEDAGEGSWRDYMAR